MPDIRTGLTRTQVAAEPESSKQSKELACHKIHLYGEKKERIETFTVWPVCEFSLLLSDSTSRCISDLDVFLSRAFVWRRCERLKR